MRILHVGNGNLKHKGQRYYDQTFKVNNGLTRNGHHVFFMSDRDVARSGNIFHIRKLGVKYANKYFIETCYNFQPEFILLSHADIISASSIKKVREFLPNIHVAQWNVDPIFRIHNIKQIKSKLDVVDATFVTTAGEALKEFSTERGQVSFIPNIVDKSVDWPECFSKHNQENDVFWALRALKGSYEGDPRIEIPLYLEKNGIKIDYHGMNNRPVLFNAEYYKKIANCKMGLNINIARTDIDTVPDPETLYLYSSDRISHYMGSGLLTFTPRENSLQELYREDEELIFFSSKEEILDKIRYYKENNKERCAIAKKGWEKAHSYYNEKIITKYMIETTLKLEHTENYAWPTTKY